MALRKQLLRFALVGAGSNLLLYLAYLLITVLGMGPQDGHVDPVPQRRMPDLCLQP